MIEVCMVQLETGSCRYITSVTDSEFSYSIYPTRALPFQMLDKCVVVLAQLQYENHPSLFDQCEVFIERLTCN
jgi:hypothetical protein